MRSPISAPRCNKQNPGYRGSRTFPFSMSGLHQLFSPRTTKGSLFFPVAKHGTADSSGTTLLPSNGLQPSYNPNKRTLDPAVCNLEEMQPCQLFWHSFGAGHFPPSRLGPWLLFCENRRSEGSPDQRCEPRDAEQTRRGENRA